MLKSGQVWKTREVPEFTSRNDVHACMQKKCDFSRLRLNSTQLPVDWICVEARWAGRRRRPVPLICF